MVLDSREQIPVPFKLNRVQAAYYDMLKADHPDMEGIREIILKSRQLGSSSFVLALFTVDFLLRPYSVSICISHRKDSTDLLFKKVKFYMDSYLTKLAEKTGEDPEKIKKKWLISDNATTLENAQNNSLFYIGTAGAKVGGRGGSARNVLFSETAFYQDTESITAKEIVLGTAQQVPQGKGMIFLESTANGEGNYYHSEWERANLPPNANGIRQSAYTPRFFGWQEFYSQQFIDEKRREFPNEAEFNQEYPESPEVAFISTGSPFFNQEMMKAMRDSSPPPVLQGKIAPDGEFDEIHGDNATVRLYRELEMGEQIVVFADPADSQDFCAAVACSKKHYDFPLVQNEVMESSQFGYDLNSFCKYIFNKTGMWPKLAVERNTGQATIYVLKTLNYPDLFRMVDFSSQGGPQERGSIGWVTTGHVSGGELKGTRRKMLDDYALAVRQGQIKVYDEETLKQMREFKIIKGKAQAKKHAHDDLVMASAGAWQIAQLTPSVDFYDFDQAEFEAEQEKWRFR